jgi:ABC-2 type transport system permease protein
MTLKITRILTLAKKELRKMIREPAVIFMIILFPLVMTVAFGASFGAVGGSQPTTFAIAVVDQSTGNSSWSHQLVQALSSTGVLKTQSFSDNATAQSELSQGRVQAVLIIPQMFDASVESFKTHPNQPSTWVNSSLQLYLDRASILSGQIVPSIVQQVLISGVLGIREPTLASPVLVSNPSFVSVSTSTVFDGFAPGLFAFASIYLIMMVASSFTTDRDNGMLRRILVTPTTSGELMMGQVVSYLLIGLVQVILVFAGAYALGYHPKTDLAGVSIGFLIATIFAICNVGFGLITAAVAKTTGAATGISFVFLLPQLFLGTFVGMALSSSAQIAGRFVPAYYVTDALTSLFTRGASATSPAVLTDLAIVSASSVLILLVGVLLFRKYTRT